MTLGPTTFAVLTWGAIGTVGLVFLYEIYALLRDADIRSRNRTVTGGEDT